MKINETTFLANLDLEVIELMDQHVQKEKICNKNDLVESVTNEYKKVQKSICFISKSREDLTKVFNDSRQISTLKPICKIRYATSE